MKYLLTLASLIFTTLFTTQVFSRTLIISDIDDTIKVSYILSTPDKVLRAFEVMTPFAGMAQLYRLLLNQNVKDSKIVYLSNAPKEIVGLAALEYSHRTFLKYNKFPDGELSLKESIFEKNHKIKKIERLIASENPDLLILIGDNGESDADVYHQVYLKYSAKIKIITFIHQVYSAEAPKFIPDFLFDLGRKIYSEQVGYVTPIEMATELKQFNLLDEKSYGWMIQNVSPYIVKESTFKWDGFKPISFPDYKNCNDFKWQKRWVLKPELLPIYNKIMAQCR